MKKKAIAGRKLLSYSPWLKRLLIMKMIAILLLVVGLTTSYAESDAQTARLNLKFTKGKVKDVLEEIEHQTNLSFMYDNDVFRVDRQISIEAENETLKSVVEKLISGENLKYEMVNRYIIITSAKETPAGQQSKKVTGNVTDQAGKPIPGASILVKGTTIGVTTDPDGNFSLTISAEAKFLVISFVGMKTQEIAIGNKSTFNIILSEEATGVDEVVVVGYGTQRKKDLTGAVAIVSTMDMKNVTATTLGEAMQGLATGVNVRASGRPGAEASIEIRGIGNFTNNSPLYVIDGLPVDANRDFNTNDIESVQILKDASAAAIYGSRAANGVIIITTKKGKEGPMQVDFSSKLSLQNLPKYDLMGREDFIKFNNMAYDNSGIARQNHLDGNTDWQEEVFKTGVVTDNNLGFSGGNKNSNYLVSLNYLSNSGATIGTKMERYNFRVNTESKRGIFTLGENMAISNYAIDELNTNPMWDVVRMLPTVPVYNPNNPGGYGYGDEARARTFGVNPVAKEFIESTTNSNFRVRGNVYAQADIFKFLNYHLNVGAETSNDNHSFLRKVGNYTLNQPYDPSILNQNKGKSLSILIEHTLNFNKKFGEHSIEGVIGTTYQHNHYEQIWAEKRNLTQIGDKYFEVLDAGNTTPKVGGFEQDAALISYLGRVSYNYADKYLFSATVRRDGSSRFKTENRWGNFPSVSGAWRLSKEKFFKVSWINDLKIRGNYGTLGNVNIGYWDYIAALNTFPQAVFGTDQHIEGGITQIKLVNEDLKWEEKRQANFGVDAGFLNNRLTTTIDYFISTTQDILVGMPIAMTTGNDGGNPFVNAASLENKGVEVSVTWKETKNDFHYSVTANFTKLSNKVLDLGYGKDVLYTWQTKTAIGRPISEFFLIKSDGLFQSNAEVLTHTNSKGAIIQPDAKPGDIRYEDVNDDGQINGSDRQFVGSPWPKFEYGINFTASYKNFDLGIYGFGSYGNKIFNGPRSVMDRFDDNSAYRAGISPWTPENTNTDFPRVIFGDQRNSRGDQDRWLENGSYFKIRQLSIGYTVPTTLTKGVFKQIKLSITGQNLITFTKYTGLDPDFVAPEIWRRGHDDGSYPNPRTYSFGLQLTF